MASPYDSAISMFNLPTYGAGNSFMPRRDDPQEAARRRLLEGGAAPNVQQRRAQRISQSADPFGVMAEVEALEKEREEESLISDIAKLDPSAQGYNQNLYGLFQKNPRLAESRPAMGLIDLQRKLQPEMKDYTSQFRDPLYRASYQSRVKSGLSPEQAYNETLNEAANEEMAIKLIESGVPETAHANLMTGGIFDRRKVAQAIADRGKDLPRTELNELLKLASDYQKNLPDPWEDEDEYVKLAREWFSKNKEGAEPQTKEDWDAAYFGLRNDRLKPTTDAWNQRLAAIEGQYRVPDEVRGLIGGAPRPLTAPTAAVSSVQAVPTPEQLPTATETVVAAKETLPAGPKAGNEQLDKLWKEYEDLDIESSINAETPDAELTEEEMKSISESSAKKNAKKQEIIKAYGLKAGDEGEMRFDELFRNRQKSGFKDYSNLWR